MQKNLNKTFKGLTMALTVCFMLVFAVLFSGCGATATNDANYVEFVSSKYDDSGRAVFEVDLNVPFALAYKVNPSTWSGYTVNYGNDATSENRRYFELIDGVITVIDNRFKPLVVDITINGHTDYCVVTLKEYPINLNIEASEVKIASQGMYTIDLLADFMLENGDIETRHLKDTDFNLRVTSSDPTKVQVPSTDRLKIYAVSKYAASATITVSILNSKGELMLNNDGSAKFTVSFTCMVVQNAQSAVLKLSGVDKFIENNSHINLNASHLTEQGNDYVLSYKIYFFSNSNLLLDGGSNVTIAFSDAENMRADYENNKILISKDILKNTSEANFKAMIISEVTDMQGNPFMINFDVTLSS